MLNILNIKSLESRRKLLILKILFKCINNFEDIPLYWTENFKINRKTRNGLLLDKPKTRNKFCEKNFFNYSIDLTFDSIQSYKK